MKKTAAFLGSLCLILGLSLASCKKDNNVTPTTSTSDSSAFKNDALLSNASTTDDTYTLQNQLNAGNVTLVAGRTYNVSSLRITHALNLNGATIYVTAKYGYPIRMTGYGASITNGTIKGSWTTSQAADANGAAGLYIAADNCSVSKVTVASFPAYGILVAAVNKPSVTYCLIKNTGYLGFYFDAETKYTSGGVFSHNTVDRSAIPASAINESGVAIRGSSNNPSIITSGWSIIGNVIKMPYRPSNWNAEGMEVRYMTNSTISVNTFTNGSIGCSIVRCSGITASWNQFSGSIEEGLEFADSKSCSSQNNTITSSGGVGILVDGSSGCNGITLTGDKISGTVEECIHAYNNTYNLVVNGATLTASANTKAINLQGTNQVKIQNVTFKGNGTAAAAIMLDNCPGNLAMTGGSASNFKQAVICIYNSKKGMTTNNVTMSGVTISGVPKGLLSVLEYGTYLGANILVKL